MNQKIEQLTDFLKNTISEWQNVECMTVVPRTETFADDPYFALVIDVYHRGKIPSARARKDAFGDPGAFESAAGRSKDRFFLEQIPIRIEYKNIHTINKLVTYPMKYINILKNSGTYPFYRLQNNTVIYASTPWIGGAQQQLASFPSRAWIALKDSFSAKMEHYLSDMGVALFSDDRYFLLVSEAGFMRYTAASVFMANRRFEPSHRYIDEHLHELERVPAGFFDAWNLLLERNSQTTPQKRFETARFLAHTVYSLA